MLPLYLFLEPPPTSTGFVIQQFARWALWPGVTPVVTSHGLVALSPSICSTGQGLSLREMGSESFLFMLKCLPALQHFSLSPCLVRWWLQVAAVPGAVPALPSHTELPAAQLIQAPLALPFRDYFSAHQRLARTECHSIKVFQS